MLVETVGY